MAKLPQNIITFAKGNDDVVKVYEQMKDYYFHFMSATEGKKIGDYDASVSLSEKEDKMHKAFLSEIVRLSGCDKPEAMSFEAWSTNPTVKWATFAVVSMMIDAIIPDTIIRSTGIYTDITPVPFGATLDIDIEPNGLYTVSESANANRTSFNKKEFNTTVSLGAVNHQITVETAMYKVLSGVESLAKFVKKAVMSIERQMTCDAYDALANLVNDASFPASLKKSGYTVEDLITLCQTVEAYNNGSKVTIVGTKKALYNVLPSSADGYRIVTDSKSMGISLIRDFFDWDILELPQVATGNNYGLKLDDSKIYVLSTGSQKIIRGVIEGETLANTDNFYDNADLTQHATLNKRWGFSAVTNATMGVMTV